ncbi:glycoside hydrolase [Hymenopellis radicata]|nr:glycoside hydrolase [Hymenopellis radicata]
MSARHAGTEETLLRGDAPVKSTPRTPQLYQQFHPLRPPLLHQALFCQLVTDGFNNVKDSSASCNSEDRKYCGGTYQGIIDKLDYIKGMGFDATWISPIVKNIESDGEAANGFAIMELSASSYFHTECFITDYNNQTDVEPCWLGDASMPLLDVDTENSIIAQIFNDWVGNLVKECSIDGIRIDTVKHVRKDLWPAFASSAGVFTIGEVLNRSSTMFSITPHGILSRGPSTPRLVPCPTWPPNTLQDRARSRTDSSRLARPWRIRTSASHTTDEGLMKNAITWTFINDAIPILYYGQEQGYTGGEDSYNREALWFSGYETSQPLVEHVTSLNAARKLAISVNKEFTSTASKFIGQSDESTLAISKPPLLTLLTNAGSSGSASWSIPSSASLFSKGDTVVDVVSCNTYTVDSSSGDLSITASSGLPKVIVPKSKLDGSVCSTTTDGALSVAANGTLLVAAVAGIFLSIL